MGFGRVLIEVLEGGLVLRNRDLEVVVVQVEVVLGL